jgi:hypothetical protein
MPPKEDRKLFVIGTTASAAVMEDLQLKDAFNVIMHVPHLKTPEQIKTVFENSNAVVDADELEDIAVQCVKPIGIKQLLMTIEMVSANKSKKLTCANFIDALASCGITSSF